MGQWITLIAVLVGGTGLGGLLTWKSVTKRTGAEAHKLEAEAAKIEGDDARAWISALRSDLSAQQIQLTTVITAEARCRAELVDLQNRFARLGGDLREIKDTLRRGQARVEAEHLATSEVARQLGVKP